MAPTGIMKHAEIVPAVGGEMGVDRQARKGMPQHRRRNGKGDEKLRIPSRTSRGHKYDFIT